MKFALITFGCRVNQADSTCLDGDLRAVGGRPSHFEDADLVVVNTCSVTASADQSARKMIRRVGRSNPGARIVVTGCYATRAAEEISALPGVEAVVPNARKEQLTDDLRTLIRSLPKGTGDGPCGVPLKTATPSRTVHMLCVQTGCDETCTYCIIPSTRGRGRSRSIEEVLERVQSATDAGFKEIVLSGVHLGSYGRDLSPSTSLLELAKALDGQRTDCRFRISSLEPMDCEPALIELVARSGRFTPHFHLPLQHGSDNCLRSMGRPYSQDDYRRVVEAVREALPDSAIGSDVMAGFPTETESDHDESVRYLADSPLTYVHVFPYADRPGTVASRMPKKNATNVVRRRASELRAVAAQLQGRFRRSAIGTVRPALILEGGGLALTDNYLKVQLREPATRNSMVNVRINSATGGQMMGEIVDPIYNSDVGVERTPVSIRPANC